MPDSERLSSKTMSTGMKIKTRTSFHSLSDDYRRRERGEGMAGRWSHGWEEYEPCGIGLTSHSLPSAAQDM